MEKKVIISIVVLVAVLIVVFMVFNQSAETSLDSSTTGDEQESQTSTVELTGETKEFTVEAFQFGYTPSVIEVNKGDKVRITAYSLDVGHGLSIREFGVNMKLLDSTPVTEEFIADKEGVFTFYCSVPCGSGHGSMSGRLIVN